MIQIRKALPTLILNPPTTLAGSPGVRVRHLQGHAGTGTMIRGPLDDVGAPAMGVVIVGRPLRVKTTTESVMAIVITAAAGPADVTGSERAPHRHLGRVHQYGGAGRPPGDIEGMETLEIDGKIIDHDESFCVCSLSFFLLPLPMDAFVVCEIYSELCGPHWKGIKREY